MSTHGEHVHDNAIDRAKMKAFAEDLEALVGRHIRAGFCNGEAIKALLITGCRGLVASNVPPHGAVVIFTDIWNAVVEEAASEDSGMEEVPQHLKN